MEFFLFVYAVTHWLKEELGELCFTPLARSNGECRFTSIRFVLLVFVVPIFH